MDHRHKFVVQLRIEGYMIGVWLTAPDDPDHVTENLDKAGLFDSVAEAHDAVTEFVHNTPILGYEVKFRGLCHPNPHRSQHG